jgi:hypothetical protein
LKSTSVSNFYSQIKTGGDRRFTIEQNLHDIEHWRGKLSWERRWRKLLEGRAAVGLEPDSVRASTFVKASPVQCGAVVTDNSVYAHLRITLVGAGRTGLQAQVDWPVTELHASSQWLREVLA